MAKKLKRKSKQQPLTKTAAKAPRHPLAGWVVFDPVTQRSRTIDFVVDGVAMMIADTPEREPFHSAVPLDRMRNGETEFKLFEDGEDFEEFLTANYPAKSGTA